MPTSNVVRHRKSSAVDVFLVPVDIVWNKGEKKWFVDAEKSGLLKMSEKEENVGADCLAHVFWGVLDNSWSNFSNTLSTESARARYMDLESVRITGTRLGHMAENWHVNSHWWMCKSQYSGLEEEWHQKRGISQWDLSEDTKVDGNLLRYICHMCPKIKPGTVITCLSRQRMRYMDK